jgi:microcystin-dependent protein
MDAYIGEIRVFGFGRIPRGWAPCNGQLMQINQNQALFSLLGTYYGGDGRTTFALPNYQGKTIVGTQGGAMPIGQAGGSETVTLNVAQMPLHTHLVKAAEVVGSQSLGGTDDHLSEVGVFTTTPTSPIYAVNAYTNQLGTGTSTTLIPDTISTSGGSTPHENRMPYQVLNVCIATTGYFPQRS